MIYDGLNHSHVVYTCKFCDKKWDFRSRFFMGDTLAYFARFLLIAHCVVHHPKEVKLKDILNGLKCGLLAPLSALKAIFIAVLQIILYPLYLLLTFLFFES